MDWINRQDILIVGAMTAGDWEAALGHVETALKCKQEKWADLPVWETLLLTHKSTCLMALDRCSEARAARNLATMLRDIRYLGN